MSSLIKKPSAWVPIAMASAALLVLIVFVTLEHFGHASDTIVCVENVCRMDEGTAAHLWQILMALQVPIIAYFALKYLPQEPKQALKVLALQALFVALACLPVYLMGK